MIITESDFEKPIPEGVKVNRFDVAFNFYIFVKNETTTYLIAYDYNKNGVSFTPFYDDLNRTAVFFEKDFINLGDYVRAHDNLLDVNVDWKLEVARMRFEELVGKTRFDFEMLPHFLTYEIQHNKKTNVWTMYKMYNYIVTDIGRLSTILKPRRLNCRVFQIEKRMDDSLCDCAKNQILIDGEFIIKKAIKTAHKFK